MFLRTKHSPLFVALRLFLAASTLAAQSYPVASITFSGTPAYSSSELLAASGLTVGAKLEQAGMQAGAQRLDSTGMFSTVRFNFNGKELHYEMTPATTLVPVRYVNFPWWDARQISDRVAAVVPWFHGQATPESGTQQKIVGALTAMLAAKQVTATVTATPDIDLATGKTRLLDFRVTAPAVQIGEVAFAGATGEWVARLAEIGKAATGQEYGTVDTPTTLTQAVESVYRDKGYLEVNVASVVAHSPIADARGGASPVRVPMTVTLAEGAQYRLGGFTLVGSVLMDQAEFVSKALLKPGDVVEGDKLRRTMRTISAPYVTRGYLRAKISATPDLHRDQRTVDYAITVTPGDVYTMGTLQVKNLDAEKTTLFLKVWKMEAGAPYDASYVAQVLKKNAKDIHALDGYSASYKQYEHEDTHIVDLVITFVKGGTLS